MSLIGNQTAGKTSPKVTLAGLKLPRELARHADDIIERIAVPIHVEDGVETSTLVLTFSPDMQKRQHAQAETQNSKKFSIAVSFGNYID